MPESIHNLKVESLTRLLDSKGIEGIYLSSSDKRLQEFFDSETSFIFNGIVICLQLKGETETVINGKVLHISPPSVILLPPNEMIETRKNSPDMKRLSVIASFDLILEYPTPLDTDILNIARQSPVVKVTDGMMERLAGIYALLETEYACSGNDFRREICKSLFYVLLLEIYDEYKKSAGRRTASGMKQEKLSDDFFLLLAQWYKKERKVGFYAYKLHRTPKYLSTAIKKITGRSVTEWINEAVIAETKVLLKTTDMTVAEISEEMVFPNPSAFVQFFKAHTGLTPHKYRTSAPSSQ